MGVLAKCDHLAMNSMQMTLGNYKGTPCHELHVSDTSELQVDSPSQPSKHPLVRTPLPTDLPVRSSVVFNFERRARNTEREERERERGSPAGGGTSNFTLGSFWKQISTSQI